MSERTGWKRGKTHVRLREFCASCKIAAPIADLFLLSPRPSLEHEKSRILVLSDVSNEPDDEESLVPSRVYSNKYDVEALVATTSTWLRKRLREDLIRPQIAAYASSDPDMRCSKVVITVR